MKHIVKKEPYQESNKLSKRIFTPDSIFFDIETTGFSPSASSLYLIGCMYHDGRELCIEQFFAETPDEESDILNQFIHRLESFTTILSFNGVGFDLPYIKAKCDRYHIPQHFLEYQYVDIYKLVGEIKYLLKLENYKQKTIETFLGIQRDDRFSGGELISVYEDYVRRPSDEAETLLLLHNFEDVIGMLDLLPILTYSEVLSGQYVVKTTERSSYVAFDGSKKEEIIITLQNDYSVPKRVSYQQDDFYITMNKDQTKLRIPIFEGELKYFYPDYKDYFYLPVEDIAIHKSVASFVDKQYRERAKACNCYNRKTGKFLPQYEEILNPHFKQEHKDKHSYFELTDDFLHSDVFLRRYINHIFKHMHSKNKKRQVT